LWLNCNSRPVKWRVGVSLLQRLIIVVLALCCFVQSWAAKPKDGPVLHWSGIQLPVEINGGLIPIQNRPFNPCVFTLLCEPGEMREQRFADALAAKHRKDKEVLQINTGAADKSRETEKI